MPKQQSSSSRATIRVSKQYPTDSLRNRQYQALKNYYGEAFDEVFFQAAWSVLGPFGSALNGASKGDVTKQVAGGRVFIQSVHTEVQAISNCNQFHEPPTNPTPDPVAKDELEDIPQAQIVGDPFA